MGEIRTRIKRLRGSHFPFVKSMCLDEKTKGIDVTENKGDQSIEQ